MMLPAQGPTTSLMEDLSELGLVEGGPSTSVQQTKQPDAKGGDYAGPPGEPKAAKKEEGDYAKNVGDAGAGHRTEVVVRKNEKVAQDKPGTGEGPVTAEDETAEGEDVAEGADAPTGSKMVPAFLIPSAEEVAEAEQAAVAEAEEDKLAKAWEVINAYFAEDEDGLSEDGLRGVINAFGYAMNVAVEDIAQLTAENQQLSEAVNELTGLLHEAEKFVGGDDEKSDDKDEGEDEDEDEDEAEEKPAKKLPPWLQKAKKQEESRRAAANLTESADLNSLLDELRGITESSEVKAIDTQAKIIEGFEACRDSCAEIYNRIVDVMRQDAGLAEGEELEVDAEDERVQLAQFFESIANDAETYLARLADGDVPFAVAEADLGRLHGDMEKGIEAMHTVE